MKQRVSTREEIIRALSEDFPLTLKGLKQALHAYGIGITYQAIHKELIKLVQQHVLDKTEDKKYLLNKDWVEQQHQFFSVVATKYSGQHVKPREIIKSTENGKVHCLTFERIVDLDEYFFAFFSDLPFDTHPVIMHYKHNWYPFLYAGRESKFIENAGVVYGLCGSNLPVDRIATEYEKTTGMRVRISKGIAQTWNTYIYKDTIIQISHDQTILRKIERLYASEQSDHTRFLKRLIDLVHAQGTIQVVIFSDVGMANVIRKKTMAMFLGKGS